jgi:hypothetical protein
MALEADALAKAHDRKARLQAAERAEEDARVLFNRTIRQLHAAGGTLREIAAAVGLSRQRVHQIVDGGGVDRPTLSHDASAHGLVVCGFCGRGSDEVLDLLAGDDAYICDGCVPVLLARLSDRDPNLLVDPNGATTCSFCYRRRLLSVTVNPSHAERPIICEDCLHSSVETLSALSNNTSWEQLKDGGQVLR